MEEKMIQVVDRKDLVQRIPVALKILYEE